VIEARELSEGSWPYQTDILPVHPKNCAARSFKCWHRCLPRLGKSGFTQIKSLAELFHTAVAKSGLPYVVLAGIDNRESHCGVVLTREGWSDNNDVFGIMQIDCLGPNSSFSSVYFFTSDHPCISGE